MNIEILSAKIREGLFLDYQYKESTSDNISNEITNRCSAPVHADLLTAFRALKPHVAVLHGILPDDVLHAPESDYLAHIEMKSIDFGTRLAVKFGFMVGSPIIPTGSNVNLGKFDFNAHSDLYKHTKDLQEKVNVLYAEVLNYHNGKFGEGAQLSVDFDGGISEVVSEGKAKRGRKKKMEVVKDDNDGF